jgi:hypothetical protein
MGDLRLLSAGMTRNIHLEHDVGDSLTGTVVTGALTNCPDVVLPLGSSLGPIARTGVGYIGRRRRDTGSRGRHGNRAESLQVGKVLTTTNLVGARSAFVREHHLQGQHSHRYALQRPACIGQGSARRAVMSDGGRGGGQHSGKLSIDAVPM